MLVKILSFIASVMSNARYKAVLIPCTIVVLSISSLTAVALVHESGSRSAASTTGKTGEDANGQQAASPQVNGGVQSIKDGSDKPVSPDGQTGGTAGNGSEGSSSKPSTPTNPSPANTDIVLTASGITVEADSTSNSLTATSSDGTVLTWSVAPESNDTAGIQVAIEKAKEPSVSLSFRFRASQSAAAGQHQFAVTAKDPNRGINISKIITITVVQ